MVATDHILFDPSSEIAEAVIAAMTNPAASFDALAAAAKTTSEALALWLQRPEIRERIESTDKSTTWRNRLIANNYLYTAPPALAKILLDHTNSHTTTPNPDQALINSLDPDSEAASFRRDLLNLRRAETTRKAAGLLFTLTKSRPTAGPDLPQQPQREPRAQAREYDTAQADLQAEAHGTDIAPPSRIPPTTPPPPTPEPTDLDANPEATSPHDFEPTTDHVAETADSHGSEGALERGHRGGGWSDAALGVAEPVEDDRSSPAPHRDARASEPHANTTSTTRASTLKSEISNFESPASANEHWP